MRGPLACNTCARRAQRAGVRMQIGQGQKRARSSGDRALGLNCDFILSSPARSMVAAILDGRQAAAMTLAVLMRPIAVESTGESQRGYFLPRAQAGIDQQKSRTGRVWLTAYRLPLRCRSFVGLELMATTTKNETTPTSIRPPSPASTSNAPSVRAATKLGSPFAT